jgi:phosphopentomutase
VTVEDSTVATLKHSRRVDELLLELMWEIGLRVTHHDESKLQEPEKSMFDEFTPKLRDSTYGSDEYKGFLEQMGVALQHHYDNNRHHPEHFENGVDGMTLVDLVEMLADWKAATERHEDGDLARSLEIQQERFGLTPQLVSILRNTAVEAGWL